MSLEHGFSDCQYRTEVSEWPEATHVTISPYRNRKQFILNIHPKDIESLKVRSGTRWTFCLCNDVEDGGGGVELLVFVEDGKATSPKVHITNSGWGQWLRICDKGLIERTILRGPIRKRIYPHVEVRRDIGSSPVMVVLFPGWDRPNSERETFLIARDDTSLSTEMLVQNQNQLLSEDNETMKSASSVDPVVTDQQNGEASGEVDSVAAVAARS
jgi:hypothetical protein